MMDSALIALGAVVGAYLVGGIPSAFLVGKIFYRTDIREFGSGNVGATNAYRVLGPAAGALVAVADVAKGWGPVAITAFVAPDSARDGMLVAASLAAILGHSFTPYLGFSGGKGVATAAGALLYLTPLSVMVLLPVFGALVLGTRIVSVGSLVIAILYPMTVLVFYSDRPFTVAFSFAAAALVIWRHRSNIRRLLRGEERRIAYRGMQPRGEDPE